MVTRDEALYKLVALRNLYEHPNTNEHEAASARAMAAKLRTKYDIPEHERPKPPPGPTVLDDVWHWMAQKAAEEGRRRAEATKRQREKRERAQRDWAARMADKDDMGQPLTAAEREEAMRDPLGFAAKRDQRSQQQKQRDMQDSFGQASRPRTKPRCDPKLPFYDVGGEPRKRNQYAEPCVSCGTSLSKGQGGAPDKMSGYACCDTVPGPRNKRSDRE